MWSLTARRTEETVRLVNVPHFLQVISAAGTGGETGFIAYADMAGAESDTTAPIIDAIKPQRIELHQRPRNQSLSRRQKTGPDNIVPRHEENETNVIKGPKATMIIPARKTTVRTDAHIWRIVLPVLRRQAQFSRICYQSSMLTGKTMKSLTPPNLSIHDSGMNNMDTTSSSRKPKRPVGVTIVGVIAIAGGLLSLFGGASVLSGMASGPLLLAVTVVVFGVSGVGLGAGLLGGKSWAWMPTIIVYVLSIPLGTVEILYGGTIGGIGGVIRIVAGIVIPLYLSRPSAKAFFK